MFTSLFARLFTWFEGLTPCFPLSAIRQPPNNLWEFFRFYCRGYEVALASLALFTLFVASIEVALFSFLGNLVDWLGRYQPETLLEQAGPRLWVMSFLVLVGLPVVVLLHSLTFHQTLFINFSNAIRWQAHRYLLGQSHAFYQDEFAGRLATKVMQTSESLRETVMKLMDLMLYVLVYLIGMVALIIAADWRLSLPILVWIICYGLLLSREVPQLKSYANRQAQAQSEMTGRIVDSYTNFHTLKLFAHNDRESAYARESMEGFLDAVYPLMRRVTLLNVALWILNALLIFATGAVSIWLWMHGNVSTGAITVAVALTLRLKSLSQFIMWEVAALFRNLGTVQNGMETLSQPYAVQEAPQATELQPNQGDITFDDVSFQYAKAQPLFQNLSLHIRGGEKVGVVGASGAGKSTLISLLLRLHELNAGSIRIDDSDISQVSLSSLRASIGVVSQDTSLLHRSIRENLLYGNPNASEEDLHRVVAQAHVDSFIQSLRDSDGRSGYDAHVGERGVKLSGGQRQRIAIARVLLKDAPILILDEATSALDSEIEAAIQENFRLLVGHKTVIAIAHRLSTIAAMDRLIVMDQGRIVEQGTHADLLAANGRYAQLWKHQSGGFLGER